MFEVFTDSVGQIIAIKLNHPQRGYHEFLFKVLRDDDSGAAFLENSILPDHLNVATFSIEAVIHRFIIGICGILEIEKPEVSYVDSVLGKTKFINFLPFNLENVQDFLNQQEAFTSIWKQYEADNDRQINEEVYDFIISNDNFALSFINIINIDLSGVIELSLDAYFNGEKKHELQN